MSDIAIAWDPANARGDWVAGNGDLVNDAGLTAAVLVSLFTWRYAGTDYRPPAGSSPSLHGWWADTYAARPIGSRLWTLRRRIKADQTTLIAEAQDICAEALQWLIDDGVASAVQIACSWIDRTTIGIAINVVQPGNVTIGFRFGWAWVDPGAAAALPPPTFNELGDPSGFVVGDPSGFVVGGP